MTVYVDEPRSYDGMLNSRLARISKLWCHLWADSEDELVTFAERLGLNLDWIQHAGSRHVHFDLVPRVRQKAIGLGAVAMSRREYLKLKRATEDGRPG